MDVDDDDDDDDDFDIDDDIDEYYDDNVKMIDDNHHHHHHSNNMTMKFNSIDQTKNQSFNNIDNKNSLTDMDMDQMLIMMMMMNNLPKIERKIIIGDPKKLPSINNYQLIMQQSSSSAAANNINFSLDNLQLNENCFHFRRKNHCGNNNPIQRRKIHHHA